MSAGMCCVLVLIVFDRVVYANLLQGWIKGGVTERGIAEWVTILVAEDSTACSIANDLVNNILYFGADGHSSVFTC